MDHHVKVSFLLDEVHGEEADSVDGWDDQFHLLVYHNSEEARVDDTALRYVLSTEFSSDADLGFFDLFCFRSLDCFVALLFFDFCQRPHIFNLILNFVDCDLDLVD